MTLASGEKWYHGEAVISVSPVCVSSASDLRSRAAPPNTSFQQPACTRAGVSPDPLSEPSPTPRSSTCLAHEGPKLLGGPLRWVHEPASLPGPHPVCLALRQSQGGGQPAPGLPQATSYLWALPLNTPPGLSCTRYRGTVNPEVTMRTTEGTSTGLQWAAQAGAKEDQSLRLWCPPASHRSCRGQTPPRTRWQPVPRPQP